MFRILILTLITALTGCGSRIYPTPEAAENHTKITDDEYQKVTRITLCGSDVNRSRHCLQWTSTRLGEAFNVQGYYFGSNWIFINQCIAKVGGDLGCKKLSTDVSGGQVMESYSFSLSEQQLRDYATTGGIDFRMDGEKGKQQIFVPSPHILGFLSKVNKYKASGEAKYLKDAAVVQALLEKLTKESTKNKGGKAK